MLWTWFPVACWYSIAALLQPAPNPRAAVISAEEADDDFAVQGEYLGCLAGACGRTTVGLQIVALGNGKFQGLRFEGGLPGHGAIVLPGQALEGRREGERVLLTGSDGSQVEIAAGRAHCRAAAGAGALDKIERVSPTMGALPPPNAVVLFGDGVEPQFDKFKLAADGTLLAGATTRMPVHDFTLHVEFRTPYMPQARGQGRGNSGVYIQRRYEVQVLDSFGLAGTSNECGGLYRQQAPGLNMCLPPLSWQTYDIQFRAARWDATGRQKVANAELTVFHNGVAVHYHHLIPNKTGAGQIESPQDLPIYFQDHGNPVTFRNVWIVLDEPAAAESCPPARRPKLAARLFRGRR